ncbi:MAG: T9SS type A sorting domain-containing protein [candidate division Zixibacteria bacterium]|nr:T9SS type A sorting domain-containing protein [candidate division Zixibacteria bacterium]
MNRLVFIFTVGLLILCFIAVPVSAQDTLWTKRYGGEGWQEGRNLSNSMEDGFVIVGKTDYGNVGWDAYLVKTDSLGDTLWTSVFGGSGHQTLTSICTTDGGYMIGGSTSAGEYGGEDFWLLFIGENGDSVWSRTYGGSNNDYCRALVNTGDGGYILAGTTHSYGAGHSDCYVVKTNSVGDTLWTRTYGWSGDDKACYVRQTVDGGFVIAGLSEFNESTRAYLVRTDAQGEVLWYNLEFEGNSKVFLSVKQTSDGGFVAAGYTVDWSGGYWYYRFYIVKYDSLGNKEWSKQYGEYPYMNVAFDVLQTVDGGYIVVGSRSHDGIDTYIVRTDSQGELLWSLVLNSPGLYDELFSIKRTGNNEYVATGWFDWDMWLINFWEPSYCCEVDMVPDDDPVIVQPGGSFGYTGALLNPTEEALAFDVWVGVIYENQFFQTRLFEGTEPLGPGEFLTRHFRQYVPNYAPLGDYRYIAYGGNYPSKCDSVWFDFTVEGAPLADGNRDWGVTESVPDKIGRVQTCGREGDLPSLISIDNSPNPFNAATTITYQLPEAANVNLAIYNLSGQKIATLVDGVNSAGEYSVTWEASDEASGIYFYKLTAGENSTARRMVLLK